MFLAYMHARPDGRIFYVGKGTSMRVSKIERSHNPHHSNIVAKYGRENILVGKMECSSESIAFELEKGLIKCLRRSGVDLVNLSEGGEGQAGYRFSEEWKIKHREKQAISLNRLEVLEKCRKNNSMNNKLSYEKMCRAVRSPEVRAKIGQATKNRSAESQAKMKASVRAACCKPFQCVETGQVFEALPDAVTWLRSIGNLKASKQMLQMVLSGRHKTAYGFHWLRV